MTPLVSVVIPCYNQAHFLDEAIESVLAQSHPAKEVVVIDDGSTDTTAQVAERRPVRYIHQRNRGLAEARNRGIRESQGELLVFLDADDRLLPDALTAGVAALRSHPECAFVFGGYRLFAFDGSPLPMQAAPPEDEGSYLTLLVHNHIGCGSTVMYRRDVFARVGGFDARFNPAEDYEHFLRIARQFPIHRHPQIVAEYRTYATSMSGDSPRMLRAIERVLRAQQPHLGGQEHYHRAWLEGIRGNRAYYIDRMKEQLKGADGRRLSLARRLGLYRALLRWDRRSLVKVVAPRVYCRLFKWRDALHNRWIRLARLSWAREGTIVAAPNPIRTSTLLWNGPGVVTLTWQSSVGRPVNVRVNAPDGPLFSDLSPAGRADTGEWVADGTRFYLLDVSEPARPRQVLAVVTVAVIPE